VGQKDLSEKILEDYNDVFADIINGLIFKGKQVINPNDLRNGNVHSQYKTDDNCLHELERDVLKDWVSSNVRIAICGIENQTKPEKNMVSRVFGYEGNSYRSQLLENKDVNIVPVVTLVLYFGTDKKWNYPISLSEQLNIPEGMEEYVNDFKINLFNIAWLTDEEINRFKSDFRIVANFFANKRRNKDYIPNDKQEIEHVDEILKLLSVMTGDNRYEKILEEVPEKGKVHNMCDVATRLENIGMAKGIAEGKAEGKVEGENLMAKLINMLLSAGRTEDALKATSDENARKEFYKEFGIID